MSDSPAAGTNEPDTSTDADVVLEAFNAEDVVENPGELDEPESPVTDTDVPPPL